MSTRNLSNITEISQSSIQRILRRDLKFYPYKVQVQEMIKPGNNDKRLHFAQELIRLIRDSPDLIRNLWISDEAYFTLSGQVNKQNYRFWAGENIHFYTEEPLYSDKILTWCAISTHGIIGPYFIKGNMNT